MNIAARWVEHADGGWGMPPGGWSMQTGGWGMHAAGWVEHAAGACVKVGVRE